MDFSNIARQLNESPDDPAYTVAAASAEKATAGGQMQQQGTNTRKGRQKAQMSQTTATPTKSNVSYASEEARLEREATRMMESSKSDWRKELNEALNPDNDPNHPYVDVMPFMNQKAKNAKEEAKTSAAADAGKQAKMAEGSLNPFQVHFDKDGKSYTSKGSKKSGERIARNISANRKSGPMAQDPYKSRAGESD